MCYLPTTCTRAPLQRLPPARPLTADCDQQLVAEHRPVEGGSSGGGGGQHAAWSLGAGIAAAAHASTLNQPFFCTPPPHPSRSSKFMRASIWVGSCCPPACRCSKKARSTSPTSTQPSSWKRGKKRYLSLKHHPNRNFSNYMKNILDRNYIFLDRFYSPGAR